MIILRKVNIYVGDNTYIMKEEKTFEDKKQMEDYRSEIIKLYSRMFGRDIQGHVNFTYEEFNT